MSFCEIPWKGAHAIVYRTRKVHAGMFVYTMCMGVCVCARARGYPDGKKTARNAVMRDGVGGGDSLLRFSFVDANFC